MALRYVGEEPKLRYLGEAEAPSNIAEEFLEEGKATAKTFWETWQKEAYEGGQKIKEAVTKPSLSSPLKLIGGLVQGLFSPLTALTEASIKRPVAGITGSETAGEIAKLAGEILLPGSVAGKLRYVSKIDDVAKVAQKEAKALGKADEGIKVAEEEAPEVIDDVTKTLVNEVPGVAEDLTKPEASLEVVKEIIDEAKKIDHSKFRYPENRVVKDVVRLLEEGEIAPSSVKEILSKYNISPKEFALEVHRKASESGRTLQQFSVLAKHLKKAFEDEKEALEVFDDVVRKADEDLIGFERYADLAIRTFQKIENKRRAFLVSQLATAMRNAWSQVGRLAVSAFDEALSGLIEGGIKRDPERIKLGFEKALNIAGAFISRLSPKGRARLERILDSKNAVIQKARLISTPVHEVGLGDRMAEVVNTFNRLQEVFFRKIAFEAKLKSLLKERGIDYRTVDPEDIPEDLIKEAVDYALEMTFSATPKATAFRDFIRFWQKTPLSTINPFPRFAFYNAPKFLFEHSPLGYIELLNPKVIKTLARGNPEKFAKIASKATLGNLFLLSAIHLRNSEYAGDKWYEIKVGNKTVDMRPFAPFSVYLLLAEMIKNPENITPSDVAQAIIGLNRIGGTGLAIADAVRNKDAVGAYNVLKRIAGEYAGSFTVPLRTIKDVVAQFSEEERIIRDRREYPLIGPSLVNIPFLSRVLPRAYSPLKGGEIKTEAPLLRQLTGLGLREKTPVESEVSRLGLGYQGSRTGVPEFDRTVNRYMGELVEMILPEILRSPEYQKLSREEKRVVLEEILGEIRRMARERAVEDLKRTNPEVLEKYGLKKLRRSYRKLLEGGVR